MLLKPPFHGSKDMYLGVSASCVPEVAWAASRDHTARVAHLSCKGFGPGGALSRYSFQYRILDRSSSGAHAGCCLSSASLSPGSWLSGLTRCPRP
eukprot:scaffold211665_cov44-Prasinocladus_malaysianus.AAC.1